MANGFLGYNRFLEGEINAFGDTVSEYADRLLYYICTYTKNPTAAEDLMEDVFAELIVRKKSFDTEKAFRAYLYKTARNKALNYIKKNARYTDWDDTGQQQEPDEQLLDEQLISRERKELLHACMAELKDEYREAVYLVYFEQLSYEQAAKVMKKSKKQIDNLLVRAKAALKTRLEREGITNLADF